MKPFVGIARNGAARLHPAERAKRREHRDCPDRDEESDHGFHRLLADRPRARQQHRRCVGREDFEVKRFARTLRVLH